MRRRPHFRELARRARHDALVLIAVVTAALSALTLLASGPIYASAVTTAAVRKALAIAPPADRHVAVDLRLAPADLDEIDAVVRGRLRATAGPVAHTIGTMIESEAFRVDGEADDTVVRLRTAPEAIAGLPVVEGTRPAGAGEAALGIAAAEALGVGIGDSLQLRASREAARRLELRLVGLVDPIDSGDDQLRSGVVTGGSFTIIGPLLVTDDTLRSGATPRLDASWRMEPEAERLSVSDVTTLRRRSLALPERIADDLADTGAAAAETLSPVDVDTPLAVVLGAMERSLTVTRTSVLALVAQVSLLAGFAIVLASRLLATTRLGETMLARSRGATRRQVASTALVESIALVVPLAVIAPWLAGWLLGFVDSVGPLAAIDIDLDLRPTAGAVLAVAVGALVAVALLSWPAFRSSELPALVARKRQRSRPTSGAQRAGGDLALGLLALTAVWQLTELGDRRVARVGSRLDVDPLLLITPAVATVAGAVLALRIVPLMARAAERIVARRRSAVPALTAFQIARRAERHSRAVLLIVMAVGIGVFAVTFAETWIDSRRDAAAQDTGGDIRMLPDRRTGQALDDLHLPDTIAEIHGVNEVMTVERRRGALPGATTPGVLLLLDAAAGDALAIRPDQAPDLDATLAQLVAARPTIEGPTLPVDAERLGLTIRIDPHPYRRDGEPVGWEFVGDLAVVVADDRGELHRIDGPPVIADGEPHRHEIALTGPIGTSGPVGPLTIADIEITTVVPSPPVRQVDIDVSEISARVGGGWTEVAGAVTPDRWTLDRTDPVQVSAAPGVAFRPDASGMGTSLLLSTGASFAQPALVFGLQARRTGFPDPIPVVATSGWLDDSRTEIGDVLRIPLLGDIDARARVVGRVQSFPTIDSEIETVLIADRPTLQVVSHEIGQPIRPLTELWIGADSDRAPAIADLLGGPSIQAVDALTQVEEFERATTDPIALGTMGALAIAFATAAVLAVVSFTISAAVAARERITEFALLRALGLTRRQLATWLAAEQGVLVATGLALGVLVGWILSIAVVPLVSVTAEGDLIVPAVRVSIPWRDVLTLQLILLATLAVVIAAVTVALRRLGLGSHLRMGEDA